MLCDRCNHLFGGEIEQPFIDAFLTKEYSLQYSPKNETLANGCGLCYRVREHLGVDSAEEVHFTARARFKFDHKCSNKQTLDGTLELRSAQGISFQGLFLVRKNESEIASLLNSNLVDTTTDSERTFEQVQAWLQDCLDNHPPCRGNASKQRLPTRLLELNFLKPHLIQLRETSKLQSRPVYMTLSHCWGKKRFFTLTSNTYKELCEGIDIGILPQTFRDAVRIALRLGTNYLWIDSLCIFQDSKEDWSREAPIMASVYQGSTCNIGASASQSSHDGCFRTRDPAQVQPLIITTSYTDPSFGNGKFLIEVDRHESIIHERDQPLFSRGWVFQERILAPRMIHFGSQYAFWECNTSVLSERYPYNHPLKRNTLDLIPSTNSEELSEKFDIWNHLVNRYSSLALTKSSDKLVAVSGVAQYLKSQIFRPSDKYLAGMWSTDLMRALKWRYPIPSYFPPRSSAIARPLPYRAPSWSWASKDGEIDNPYQKHDENTELCTIESVTIYHATADIYGEVLHGLLTIRGSLLRCEIDITPCLHPVVPDNHLAIISTPVTLSTLKGADKVTTNIEVYLDSNLDSKARTSAGRLKITLYALPLWYSESCGWGGGLLLLQAVASGQYERCGMFEHWTNTLTLESNRHASQLDAFWMLMRARVMARKARNPVDPEYPFEVTYVTGPPPAKEKEDTPTDASKWKEYIDCDGHEYLFSIV